MQSRHRRRCFHAACLPRPWLRHCLLHAPWWQHGGGNRGADAASLLLLLQSAWQGWPWYSARTAQGWIGPQRCTSYHLLQLGLGLLLLLLLLRALRLPCLLCLLPRPQLRVLRQRLPNA